MNAVILAAGRSTRLLPLTETLPKTLLPVDGRTFFTLILDALRAVDINDIHVVTGHGHDAVVHAVRAYHTRFPNVHIRTIQNPQFAQTGNITSFHSAQHLFDDAFILINSDTLFHPELLRDLLETPADHAMIIDNTKNLSEEEMKVIVDPEGFIQKIHKKITLTDAHGEYVGLLKSSSPGDALRASCTATIAQHPDAYYEDALQHFIDHAGARFSPVWTRDLPVMEVDTHEDYAHAQILAAKLKK